MPVNAVALIWADRLGRHDPLGRRRILRGDTELPLRKRLQNWSLVARRLAAQGHDLGRYTPTTRCGVQPGRRQLRA